ncbi:thioredoxin family protein [uncultured Paracoccus sp.]|uniref:thioredoxin family protein n=1 Tax=uncultured Paracoccus sp. TaxID=189685 RepID=UPI00262B1892|nr:thioredoxin family protein [uncultured Paracoccus sp.]
MPTIAPVCDFGAAAPDFDLPGTDGRSWTLSDVRGQRGTLIMFICKHCPYVLSVMDRIVRDAHQLMDHGVGVAAISANDVEAFPEDGFGEMRSLAKAHGFRFPYLYDESQAVAHAYGAECTPDFFGYDAQLGLQYRGRLDASGKKPAAPDVRRDLFEAMMQIVRTGQGPRDQVPSMGCSIKWKPS